MMKYNKTKLKWSSFVLMIIAVFTISGTFMWSIHEIEVENILQSRTVEVEIKENFPDDEIIIDADIVKEVRFENTGTASVFIRFSYAEYWETNNELLEGYSESTTKEWSTDVFSHWYDGGDGWYYYEYVLSSGDSLDILESVKFSENIPTDANYSLFFQVETVQVSDEDSVNTEAIKLLFEKKVTVTDKTIIDGAVIEGHVTWGEY